MISVDARLAALKMRRNELQDTIQNLHEEGNDWIDHVIESFELVKLAKKAIKHGSPEVRQAVLKSLGSNYLVNEENLVWDLPSPFCEKVKTDDCTMWGEWRVLNPRPSGPQPDALTN